MSEQKSQEQIAAEAAETKAKADAAKAEAKAAKDKAAAEAKEKKQAAAAEAKRLKDEAKAAEKAEKEAKAAAAAKEKADKAAAAAAEKAATAAAKVKVVMPSQNGITRPKTGTKTGDVWALADKLSTEKNAPIAIAELLPAGAAAGLNDATIRTQYARWKTFNGIFGSVKAAPKAPETPAPTAQTEQTAGAEATEPAAA